MKANDAQSEVTLGATENLMWLTVRWDKVLENKMAATRHKAAATAAKEKLLPLECNFELALELLRLWCFVELPILDSAMFESPLQQ